MAHNYLASTVGGGYDDFLSEFGMMNKSVMAVGSIILVLLLLVSLVMYVLRSIGLYKMATRKGLENPWLAFIPIASNYTLGEIVGPFKLFGTVVTKPGLTILLVQIAFAFSSLIGPLQLILMLPVLVFYFYISYLLYKEYSPDKATILLIFSIISCDFLTSIFYFAIRNNPTTSQESPTSEITF